VHAAARPPLHFIYSALPNLLDVVLVQVLHLVQLRVHLLLHRRRCLEQVLLQGLLQHPVHRG
jgi:hypothetical protein